MLVDQSVVVPGPVTEALGAAARSAGAYLVIGVQERESHGATIYNTTLYFDSRRMPWSASTASWCRPVPSAPCGAWATGPPSPSSTLPSAGSPD